MSGNRYRGVRKKFHKYEASYRGKYLGSFSTAEDASDAYEKARSLNPSREFHVKEEHILVDERFRDKVLECRWSRNKDGYLYHSKERGFLQRYVWKLAGGIEPQDGTVLDHVNGNKFDNRLENLRLVTSRANSLNRRACRKPQKAMSGRFVCGLGGTPNYIHLGTFDDYETACLIMHHNTQKIIEAETIQHGHWLHEK